MTVFHRASRVVPLLFVAAILGTTIASAVLAGPGLSPASTAAAACAYGVCPSDSGISVPAIMAIIALLAVVALVLGVLIWRDRRRGGRPPPTEWAEGGAPAGEAGMAGPAAAYTEGPEDVSVPPPELPGGAPPSAPEAGEGDIDSLMAELDRISGEILKQGPKGKKGSGGGSDGAGGGSTEGG